jgi:hypothetical protein
MCATPVHALAAKEFGSWHKDTTKQIDHDESRMPSPDIHSLSVPLNHVLATFSSVLALCSSGLWDLWTFGRLEHLGFSEISVSLRQAQGIPVTAVTTCPRGCTVARRQLHRLNALPCWKICPPSPLTTAVLCFFTNILGPALGHQEKLSKS